MTLKHRLVTAAAAAVIPLGGGLALASATGAGAVTTPLQVTLSADGNGTAVFSGSGNPVLTLGSTGTYAQMAVDHVPAAEPANAPTFATDNYASGSPRWVVELSNSYYLFGYPGQLYSPADNMATGANWSVNGPATPTCSGYAQYMTYAKALSCADPAGIASVVSAYIVEDADQAAGTADTLTGVQYNGLTLPGTVSVKTPANQTSKVNAAITPLQVTASTNTSDTALTYSANNLPTGLSIAAATGLISGTPTATGAFSTTVTATDAYGDTATSSQFTWTISAATAPPTVMTAGYVCGTSASRIVWKIKNVSGAGAAYENSYVRVSRRWKYVNDELIALGGSYRLTTHEGLRLLVLYMTNGSKPPRNRVGAVSIRAAVPSKHKRCG